MIVRFSGQHDHRISQRFVGSYKSPKQPQYKYKYTNNEQLINQSKQPAESHHDLFHGIIFFIVFLGWPETVRKRLGEPWMGESDFLSQVVCNLSADHRERFQSSIFRSKIRSAYSEVPYGPFPATKACTKRQPSRALSMISLRQSSFGFPEKSPPWSFTQTNLYSYFSFTRLFQFLLCLNHPMRGGNPEFKQERYRLLHGTPNGVHSCP